jgi:hypothetical protein
VHLRPRVTRPRLLLSAAVALLAVLALTLVAVLPGGGAGASRTAATSDTVWPYYAETIAIRPPAYDSPHGDLLIADGMSTENQGAQLFLRTADGTLQQLPWKGLIRRPNQVNIIEPSIAW